MIIGFIILTFVPLTDIIAWVPLLITVESITLLADAVSSCENISLVDQRPATQSLHGHQPNSGDPGLR